MPRAAFQLVVVFAVALTGWPASLAVAGLGPENVAVVVNADSWASMTVANAFVAARGVPTSHLIYLRDVPGYEHVGVEEFREKLLKPVLEAIEKRGLKDQIDCVAWSSDFPYAIDVGADLTAAGMKPPQVLTPTASLNGLTFLYELVLAKDPRYLDLNANWYFRRPIQAGRKEPAVKAAAVTPEEVAKFREAMTLVRDKKWAEAIPSLKALSEAHPNDAQLAYNLSCCLARDEKPDDAIAALKRAVEAGWFDRGHAEKDEDLKALRDRDDFKALLGRMTPPLFDTQPTTGFRSSYRWNEQGDKVNEGGRKYLLSVMLAMTSGRGTSVADAVKLFESTRAAPNPEADIRNGTVYFVKNGDVRSRTREWAFASAKKKLETLGVKAEIVDGTLPVKKDDIAGAVIGTAGFHWASSGSRILPGAIVEHLTSFGGVMRENAGQTPLSEFLKAGAAGASGTVTEPYAIQAKFPSPFIHVHYASGATLAEAFYQSVQGPYQLLIVGDPLCAPWAKRVAVSIEKPPAAFTAERSFDVTLHPAEAAEDRLAAVEFSIDGRRVRSASGEATKATLPLDGLEAGWHEFRVVGVSSSAIESRGTPDLIHRFEIRREVKEVDVVFERQVEKESSSAKALVVSPESLLRMRVKASVPDAARVQIQGQDAAEARPNVATFGVPALSFGSGSVSVLGVMKIGDAIVRSAPRTVLIESTPLRLEKGRTRPDPLPAEGLLLKVEGRDPIVVTETRDANWLAKQELPAGTRFTLEADFEHAAVLGQFQTSGNCDVAVEVDDRPVPSVASGVWQYRPFWAETGWHRLRLSGTTPATPGTPPRLIVRYGIEGTQSLDGKRFRHPAP